MKDGYYFVIKLTESEHDLVLSCIDDYCKENELQLKYYRKLKTGHVPMLREVKIIGGRNKINKMKKYLNSEGINLDDCIVKNYWELRKQDMFKLLSQYTKEELEEISKKYNIDIRDLCLE